MDVPSGPARNLEAYLAEKTKRGQFAGSVLLTVDGKALLERSYGTADRTSGAPITRETAFQIASVSKHFTAAAVLLLHERGKLSPKDPIRRWIRGAPESWEPISINHLLTHTSGLPHWRDIPELDLFAPASADRVLAAFSAHPLKFPPGTAWAYSSPGYHLLARVVEEASEEPYAEFLSRNIFEPLGMIRTRAGNRPADESERARGYAAGEPVVPFELETASRGTGDVWSTTEDLARWDRAVSTPGRCLSKASLDLMFARNAALPAAEARRVLAVADLNYGYGWYLGDMRGMELRFHPGDNPGYRSINVHIPEARVILCVLSNEETSDLSDVGLRLLEGLASGL